MSSSQETSDSTYITASNNALSTSAGYYILYNTLPKPELQSPLAKEENEKKPETKQERHPSHSSGTTFWEEDKWSEEFELKAKKTLERNKQKCQLVSTIPSYSKFSASSIRFHNGTFWVHKYEKEAHLHWDGFYERNQTNFFKDRHYLHKTFPNEARYFMGEHFDADAESEFDGEEGETVVVEDEASQKEMYQLQVKADSSNLEKYSQVSSNKIYTLFEIGCGVGNNILPLLSKNPNLDVRCFDFSSVAIDLLNENPQFIKANEEHRASAHVWDITKTLQTIIPSPPPERPTFHNTADFTMLLFCLSAINPEKMQIAVHHVASTLKPGGVILFRDYGRYDEAQMKLGTQRGKGLGENFYVKHDGTRCYYFDLNDLQQLFGNDGFGKSERGARLEILELDYIRRSYMNRSTKTVRRRVWVQGRFRKPLC